MQKNNGEVMALLQLLYAGKIPGATWGWVILGHGMLVISVVHISQW
jgi:hypothetical protein